MKVQIRQGIFETNSSSEHSLSIVSNREFQAWKSGKLYARLLPGGKEFKETWGNFWSTLYEWEFKEMSCEEVDTENDNLFEQWKKRTLESLDAYEKRIEEEIDKPIESVKADGYWESEEEREHWAISGRKYIKERREDISKYTYKGINSTHKLDFHFWITYDEYMDALRHGDCYSPFEHEQGDVSVFGTYFHS